MTETTADLLEIVAQRIEATPGTNVLDALRESLPTAETRREQGARDLLAADAYYALLDYLPPHVTLLAPWSDSETAERVAEKLRQLARTIRKGGPVHISAVPPLPPEPADTNVVERAEHGNRRGGARRNAFQTDETQLRHRRGVLASVLVRQQKANHPQPHKILETELAMAEIDRQLAELAEPAEPAASGL